jgi:hypothetical protein
MCSVARSHPWQWQSSRTIRVKPTYRARLWPRRPSPHRSVRGGAASLETMRSGRRHLFDVARGGGRGTVYPRMARTRCVAPSAVNGRLVLPGSRGLPSTSIRAMPRDIPLGFSTVIS